MRCESCPVESGSPCIGEHARRICDLCNPAHPAYRPGYRESISGVSYPALTTQASNAFIAAGQAIASGFKARDEAEQARCLEICRGCEYFDAARGKCRRCGCPVRSKARFLAWHCPIGKW